jgi:hypothetical protein
MLEEDLDLYDEPRPGFRIAAGAFDFLGVIACTLLIVALMAIMGNLFTWLRQDLNTTLAGLGRNINEAVVVDAHRNQ